MAQFLGLVSYLGADFCGWQKQARDVPIANEAPSVQETIETILSQITQERVTVVASGRTDAGVHALGQVVHFFLEKKSWEPHVLRKALNSLLPNEIRFLEVLHAPEGFHAQRSALKKQYSYYFQQGPTAIPHLISSTRWVRRSLDLEKMKEGLDHILGKHDFKAFQASGSSVKTTVREILEVEIEKVSLAPFEISVGHEEYSLLRMRVIGTGFLKQMVRGIAGTALQVGEGYREPAHFKEILKTRDRSLVGPTAAARALWLDRVWYHGVRF
jgi:tRNA pseudouridine38-40 synthase